MTPELKLVTPGPWRTTEIFDVRDCTEENRFVASVFGRGIEQKKANADLIAAAPELLEALKAIQVSYKTLCSVGSHAGFDACAAQIASAIAKAEGRALTA